MRLDPSQSRRWGEDGFLVIPGFVDAATCDRLMARAGELLAGFDPAILSIFSTRDQTRTTDEYFLESGDKIRFFVEDGAVDAGGRLNRAKELAVNKIGHAQHDLDPVFAHFSHLPAIAELAGDLGFTDPRLVQSMYIFKQPEIGGEVVSHQDSTFLYTEPETVVGFWFALEDATVDNGCLWAVPGGHRFGLRTRFVRTGRGVGFKVLDDGPPPSGDLVPLEAPKGTLVLLHGRLPHQSGPNRSRRSRHAYSVHIIDGTADYPADNWLQRRPDLPLRGFQPLVS